LFESRAEKRDFFVAFRKNTAFKNDILMQADEHTIAPDKSFCLGKLAL